eukprot:6172010-Pleurochrysis_carterae.AAC.2
MYPNGKHAGCVSEARLGMGFKMMWSVSAIITYLRYVGGTDALCQDGEHSRRGREARRSVEEERRRRESRGGNGRERGGNRAGAGEGKSI